MSLIGNPREGLRQARYRIRLADACDAAIVRALDDACFPPDSLDQQRADPGELEDAVRVGDVRLLEVEGEVVGYLHADTSVPGRIYVSGLAVRPDAQGAGLGTMMVDECLASIDGQVRARVPIVTITSPRNLVMLRLSFTRGFAARWVRRDFFGPGRDRFACQLRINTLPSPEAVVRTVPAARLDRIYPLVEDHGYVVTALVQVGGVAHFELIRSDGSEFPPQTPP